MSTLVELKNSGQLVVSVKVDDLFLTTTDPSTDPATKVVTLGGIANSLNQISANAVPIMKANTPANSTPVVKAGVFFYDANYLYVAVDNNSLKRVALSSF
ncbi:hypothetical protein [Caulobacter phage Cr30]|uniref:hypothetical protein n=1 Tax=Caulobacter phage Cr30 TaxID=1357714 RepID=UPI0004A9B6D3|nr:hypothetical protein OZ74_gp062 [Caulobacter phage Cr30]AGS80947.1 hypothetical protein [Caulobacter phage Cr30]